MQRIVLAYSGGLDTSLAIPWLQKKYDAEIIAVMLDLGQRGELVEVRQRALALGATRCHVIDAREEFVRGYIQHALQADALDTDGAPMATALSRPLIVRKLVDVARMESATTVAHGAMAGSGDERRLETLVTDLDPALKVIAPARIWELETHEQKIAYARSLDVAIPIAPATAYRVDSNLWGRTVTATSNDQRTLGDDDDLFALTRAPKDCPDQAADLTIELEAGVATRVNGIEMLPLEMLESLDIIAGTHGVGRIVVAADARGAETISEAPSAVVLHTAHRELQNRMAAPETIKGAEDTAHKYAAVIDDGRWFSPDRAALDAVVSAIQPSVNGSVHLRLFKGQCSIVDVAVSDDSDAERVPAADSTINSL
jgi:argininosuccinate synthase